MIIQTLWLLLLTCDISKGHVVVSGSDVTCFTSDGKVQKGPGAAVHVVGSTTDNVIRAYDAATEITVENVEIVQNVTVPVMVDASNVTLVVKGQNTFRHISESNTFPEGCFEDWWTCAYAEAIGCHEGSRLTIVGVDDASLEAHTTRDAGIGSGGYGLMCEELVIRGLTVNATGYGGAGIGGGMFGSVRNFVIDDAIVSGESIFYGAGIGGGMNGSVDTMLINNSIASGVGLYGAGIGTGFRSVVEKMVVWDSIVNATSLDAGAGIGTGYKGQFGDCVLNESIVMATGGHYGAGIGAGHECGLGMNRVEVIKSRVWATGSWYTDGIGKSPNAGLKELVVRNSEVKAKGRHGETLIKDTGVIEKIENGGINVDVFEF